MKFSSKKSIRLTLEVASITHYSKEDLRMYFVTKESALLKLHQQQQQQQQQQQHQPKVFLFSDLSLHFGKSYSPIPLITCLFCASNRM